MKKPGTTVPEDIDIKIVSEGPPARGHPLERLVRNEAASDALDAAVKMAFLSALSTEKPNTAHGQRGVRL
jgi:hypothetical protein